MPLAPFSSRRREARPPLAGIIAAVGGFHFDDVGSVIAEEHCAIGSRKHAGEVEDADVLEEGDVGKSLRREIRSWGFMVV